MLKSIKETLKSFTSTSLADMDGVALMKRTDTKFIIHKDELQGLLKHMCKFYNVLEIEENRVMTYSSLYFDTPNKKFYLDHHNGKVNRTKIRMRKYIESDLCFLEIKQKDGKGKTNKSRIPLPDFELNLEDNSKDFIGEITQESFDLAPSIWNGFNRITLVNKKAKERVTIDLNLTFQINQESKSYSDLVIIELKQERYDRNSPIVKSLRYLRQHPYSISKYCVGMANLYPNLKSNLFKNKLLKINKLTA
jgi:hypothetical protein